MYFTKFTYGRKYFWVCLFSKHPGKPRKQITNDRILKNTTYLHAQSSKSHLGHYCYCLLASSWLAMSQQAMDNWDHQHLEDLGG